METKPTHFSKIECRDIYHRVSEPLFKHLRTPGNKLSPISYSYQLSNLECFIEELLFHEDVPPISKKITKGQVEFEFSNFSERYFRMLPSFISMMEMLPKHYEYNEHINAFIECCQELNLTEEDFFWTDRWKAQHRMLPHRDGIMAGDLFNNLCSMIRTKCQSKPVRIRIYSRRHEARERFEEYCNYVNALFDDNDRLVIVRIDFGYRKEFSDKIEIDDVLVDWRHLYNNKRNNSLFDHMKGHIIKVEYGIEKGIHLHAIFFFNGSEQDGNKHIHLTEQVGKFWQKITKNRGVYWNCNDNIDDFIRLGNCGIGLIHWSDKILRNNLLHHVVRYLCKSDQFFKPKIGGVFKLIHRGQFPKVLKNKLGRPRNAE